ncbi:MAG: excinuclease ABC subunit UvrC [Chloroflexi bacterium]|nr:excinuclease ABC subunit UvrC [Chloroflexota bacterium]
MPKTATDSVLDKVRALPRAPGIYKFKDADGRTIYVGKATSLRSRVGSYFSERNSEGRNGKTSALVAQIADVEYILTGSPMQALQWESDLIKTERPKYNIVLRDDKHYPYVRITVQDEWPRVEIARRSGTDGAKYFGPFTNTLSVRQTMDTLNRLFPYILCTKEITGKDPRPCLYFYIKRCLAPCIGAITNDQYRTQIDRVVRFMEGKAEGVLKELRQEMETASDRLEFEQAAALRDRLRAAERVVEQQAVTTTTREDEDVIGLAQEGTHACIQVFFMRGGRMVGRDHFVLQNAQEEGAPELIGSFLLQFYGGTARLPGRVLIPNRVPDERALRQWLTATAGHAVKLVPAQRGEGARLVRLATRNATDALQQLVLEWVNDLQRTSGALLELQEALNLSTIPERVECFDISHVQGAFTVASMSVLEQAKPKPSEYRRFRIRTVDHNDDFASMAEVLRRRFGHLVTAAQAEHGELGRDEKWAVIPDLVVIDGGKGQLSAAMAVLRDLELEIPTVGLAKEREEIFLPGRSDPVVLPRDSAALFLLQRVRDEAHRFAITYHRASRGKGALRSALDEIPGVGPKRKKALLRQFGSVDGIRQAPVDDLAAVPGMTRSTANLLKERL